MPHPAAAASRGPGIWTGRGGRAHSRARRRLDGLQAYRTPISPRCWTVPRTPTDTCTGRGLPRGAGGLHPSAPACAGENLRHSRNPWTRTHCSRTRQCRRPPAPGQLLLVVAACCAAAASPAAGPARFRSAVGRGIIAAQEFSNQMEDQPPDDIPEEEEADRVHLLVQLAKIGDVERLTLLLSETGDEMLDVNALDTVGAGATALTAAITFGWTEVVRTLIFTAKADVTVPDGQGRVPLTVAVVCGRLPAIKWILDHEEMQSQVAEAACKAQLLAKELENWGAYVLLLGYTRELLMDCTTSRSTLRTANTITESLILGYLNLGGHVVVTSRGVAEVRIQDIDLHMRVSKGRGAPQQCRMHTRLAAHSSQHYGAF
jgi:hypothetical protein